MKTIFKTVISILIILILFVSCDNDSDPSPNDTQCNYQGVTYYFPPSTNTFIPETDLTLDFITAGSNGPEVEVYETNNPGNFNFTTTALTANATDLGTVNYNGTTYNNTSITCQRGVTGNTGASIGDEFRWDIVEGSVEFEICMVVTSITYGYIDADGDGCGSQTISYTFGVLNNVDSDDNNPNAC